MDQIISFMVPLGLTSTNVANIIDDMVHFAYVNAREEDAVILFEPPPREFEATFKISMTEFHGSEHIKTDCTWILICIPYPIAPCYK